MFSRHEHETQPTQLPSDLLFEVSEALNIQYKNKLDLSAKETFSSNALVFPSEIVLVISLTKPSNIKNLNIYASIDYTAEKTPLNEALYYLVDSVGFFLDDFFESKRTIVLPGTWKPYNINKKKCQ